MWSKGDELLTILFMIGTAQWNSRRLRQRANELEEEIDKATIEIKAEKKKSDDLLLNILPEEVAEELKQTGEAAAKQFNEVTVLFTDFVGFTTISELIVLLHWWLRSIKTSLPLMPLLKPMVLKK